MEENAQIKEERTSFARRCSAAVKVMVKINMGDQTPQKARRAKRVLQTMPSDTENALSAFHTAKEPVERASVEDAQPEKKQDFEEIDEFEDHSLSVLLDPGHLFDDDIARDEKFADVSFSGDDAWLEEPQTVVQETDAICFDVMERTDIEPEDDLTMFDFQVPGAKAKNNDEASAGLIAFSLPSAAESDNAQESDHEEAYHGMEAITDDFADPIEADTLSAVLEETVPDNDDMLQDTPETDHGESANMVVEDDAHTAELPVVQPLAQNRDAADMEEMLEEAGAVDLPIEKSVPRQHFSTWITAAVLLTSVFLVGYTVYKPERPSAYELSVNGQRVGCIADRTDAEQQYAQLKTELSAWDSLPFSLDLHFSYEPCGTDTASILSEDALYTLLYTTVTAGYTPGYTVYVDDTAAAYVYRAETIQAALDTCVDIRASSLSGSVLSGGTLSVSNAVTWRYGWIPQADVSDEHGLISCFRGEHALEYQIIRTVVSAELLPYATEYRENDEGYDGVVTQISAGENGLVRVTVEETVDPDTGRVTASREVDREVLKTPVNAVSYDGEYPLRDDSVCTGTFLWPLAEPEETPLDADTDRVVPPVYISSLYGERDLWGAVDFHLGYDIVAPRNAEIYACDGGVVVYAGYSDSYGYVTRILHKDHVETLYAHQNAQLVKKGDIVTQGQCIGYVGATGNTNGTHLHLEFRKDHVTCSPERYITIPDWVETIIY